MRRLQGHAFKNGIVAIHTARPPQRRRLRRLRAGGAPVSDPLSSCPLPTAALPGVPGLGPKSRPFGLLEAEVSQACQAWEGVWRRANKWALPGPFPRAPSTKFIVAHQRHFGFPSELLLFMIGRLRLTLPPKLSCYPLPESILLGGASTRRHCIYLAYVRPPSSGSRIATVATDSTPHEGPWSSCLEKRRAFSKARPAGSVSIHIGGTHSTLSIPVRLHLCMLAALRNQSPTCLVLSICLSAYIVAVARDSGCLGLPNYPVHTHQAEPA